MSLKRYKVIRVNGNIETHTAPAPALLHAIQRAIGAETIDCINLKRADLVMSVDDAFLLSGKPLNLKATALYRMVCRDEHQRAAVICGDVAVAHDNDFAEGGDVAFNLGPLRCEEASTLSRGTYIPCGARATMLIDSGDTRRYPMCEPCGAHNVHNRRAKMLGPVPTDALDLVDDWVQPDVRQVVTEEGAEEPAIYQMTKEGIFRNGVQVSWMTPPAAPVEPIGAMPAGMSATPTPWAVHCPEHALVYLTEAKYQAEMNNPDARWTCPRCGRLAEWDDATYEAAMDAAQEQALDAPEPERIGWNSAPDPDIPFDTDPEDGKLSGGGIS